MRADILYGVLLADGSCDTEDIQGSLLDSGAFENTLPDGRTRPLVRYGGGNNDGAVYAGIVLDTVADGYCVATIPLGKILAANESYHSARAAFDLWWSGDAAATIRDDCGIPEGTVPSLLLVVDSD